MKTPKLGKFCCINNVIYKAYKATLLCEGCDLNNIYTCPNIKCDNTKSSEHLACIENNIILKRVKYGNSNT